MQSGVEMGQGGDSMYLVICFTTLGYMEPCEIPLSRISVPAGLSVLGSNHLLEYRVPFCLFVGGDWGGFQRGHYQRGRVGYVGGRWRGDTDTELYRLYEHSMQPTL